MDPTLAQLLNQGSKAWNDAAVASHDRDLSDCDFRALTGLLECDPGEEHARVITDLDLREANLRGARLGGLVFYDCDFRGADLSGADLIESCFRGCYFGPAESDAIVKSALVSSSARFLNTLAYGTRFEICALAGTDLRELKIDEGTHFDRVGVVGATISRAALDRLEDFGGLSRARLGQMKIEDDFALLRRSFGGFWNGVHAFAMTVFLAPYAWFLVRQWTRSSLADGMTTLTDGSSISIGASLVNFAASGGDTWREWDPQALPLALFVVALAFNLVRVALFVKTKVLEHELEVTGLTPHFRMGRLWETMLLVYRTLGVIGITAVIAHTMMFLSKPVPS